MNQSMLFEQLCAINNTIERLAKSQDDSPMQVALESIVQALDEVIDHAVDADLLMADDGVELIP
jgi:hypothetical protein